jgi:Rrf2 family cysteine metabolism transcriptional repressor
LAIAPQAITLETVMNILEGVTAPLDCLEEPSDCTLSIVCAQREMWSSVEAAIRGILRSTTINDLAERQKILVKNKLVVA